MNKILLAAGILVVSGCSNVSLGPEFQEVDTALRQQGITPNHGSTWEVELPPQVFGEKLHRTFLEKYMESKLRGEYIHRVRLIVDKKGWVHAEPIFRGDQREPVWHIGLLPGAEKPGMDRAFFRVQPMGEEETQKWIRGTLIPRIKSAEFKEWMKDLE